MPKVENKIKVKGRSGKGFRSKVVLEGPADLMDTLLSNEQKSAKKIWQRDDNFKKLSESTEKLLNNLLGNAGFKEVIYRMFARKHKVSLLNLLHQELRRKFLTSFLPSLSTAEMNNMGILIKNLVTLNRVYSSQINLRKKEDDTISIEQGYGLPSYVFFKTEGQNITKTVSPQRDVSFFKRAVKYQRFFNEIEIEDETALDSGGLSHPTNPLFEILSLASNVSPTIVKYTRPDGFKKMLICLPPDLDITTVTKRYRTLISKAHRDFYKRKFKGRPQSKKVKVEWMREIWEKELKGKTHPVSTQCVILSRRLKDKYDIDLAAITIRRHYLKVIKGRKIGNK
jgi:hypothetical protein